MKRMVWEKGGSRSNSCWINGNESRTRTADALYKRFPGRILGRDDIVQLVREGESLLALIAAMIWGGIEPRNLSRMLDMGDTRLDEIIRKAHRLVSNGKIREAFCFFERDGKIGGVAVAYHTKILFFLGQAELTLLRYPLIFDKWTKNAFCAFLYQVGQSSLAKDYFPRFTNEVVEIRWSKLVDAYESYVINMNEWAHELSVKPSKLEEFV